MNLIAINTSQNVNIDFSLAGFGERFVAFLLDWLIKGAYLFVIFYILGDLLDLGRFMNNIDGWTVNAIFFIIGLPVYVYTLVSESMMEGQTLGKKIMKIKVVKIDGYQASFGDYLMRWMFRLVDIYSNFGVVGLISIVATDKSQRLGDVASGSAVISLKNKVDISHTILENLTEDYVPTFPQVILLSDNDLRIIKENYINANKNHDRTIINKLAKKIKETIKLEKEMDLTDAQFINTVIKDYNFYTGKDL